MKLTRRPASDALRAETVPDPLGLACGFGASLIWGAWPVISKLGTRQDLGAADIAALRFGVAGFLLLPFFMRSVRRVSSWPLVLVMVFGAGVPYVIFGIGGMAWQSVTHAAVMTPTCSLMISSLGAWLLLGEAASSRRWVAIGMLGAGVLLVGADGWANATGSRAWIGDLMFCASGCLWGSFTLSMRKSGLAPLHAASLVSVCSAAIFLPVYFGLLAHRLGSVPFQALATQGIFQGIFAAIIGMLLFTTAIARLGAGRAALFIGLIPGIAVMLSWLMLGERPGAPALAGLVLATLGMWIALSSPPKRLLR